MSIELTIRIDWALEPTYTDILSCREKCKSIVILIFEVCRLTAWIHGGVQFYAKAAGTEKKTVIQAY